MKHSYVLSRNCLKLTPALLGLILVQNLLVQNLGLALPQTWVRIPALLLTSSVTLGQLLDLCVSPLFKGDNWQVECD